MAASLRGADPQLDLRLLAPRRGPLKDLGVWTQRAVGLDQVDDALRELEASLVDRDEGSPPVVLVVDDGSELFDGGGDALLAAVLRRGRDTNLSVIAAAESQDARRAYGGWAWVHPRDHWRTDSVGDADYNYKLSQRRADAVVNYLQTKYNIPPHKFYLIGIGKQDPVADNHSAAGRAKNRRVDVKLMSNMTQSASSQSASNSNHGVPSGVE